MLEDSNSSDLFINDSNATGSTSNAVKLRSVGKIYNYSTRSTESTESLTAPKKRGRPKKVIMAIEDEPEPVMRRSKRNKN